MSSRCSFIQVVSVFLTVALAVAPLRAFAEDDTQDAEKDMVRGSEAMARGEFKDAVIFFRAAHKLKPTATGPVLALGLALRADGQCEEAVSQLEAYLKAKPGNAKATEALGACRKSLKSGAPPSVLPSGAAVAAQVDPQAEARGAQPGWYRRWYVWAGVGAVVVGGVVAGVMLASRGAGTPHTDLGNMAAFGASKQ